MNRRQFVASGVAAAIATGEQSLEDIYSHIQTNLPVHIENIQSYIRQPSISAEKVGIAECAELTRSFLQRAGCQDAELVPTKGHPVVWGRLDAGAAKTLIIYWMYDVQPVNASEWATPPFGASVVDAPNWGPKGRLLRGRGASNQKGPERAFLNAVESIRAVRKNLPVNLMFICEGEEELGSPNLPEAMQKLTPRLSAANGVLFPSVTLGRDGVASFALGNKGVAYIELECRGGARGGPTHSEVHSSLKAATDSPVWRLVQALATFTDRSGNHIAIEGVRDRIRRPTQEILAREAFGVFERQCKLTRGGRCHIGFPPV